jgi:RNA polymerase sigma-70 factor, ECF subfamily
MADVASLVARARDGDAEAFTALVERYYEVCVRYAWRFLGHREDAEDAVQDTWLRVHRALDAYRERDVFERWLFRILLNACRASAERRRRENARMTEDLSEIPADESAGAWREPVETVLARLDPRTREAVLLKYGLGLDYLEMARRTGDSVSALKMRVKRGLDSLRPYVLREGEP